MAALPLNTAPHFVFCYRFCNFLDFYCALHQKKNCFYHFQGHLVIIKEFSSKFKDNSRTNCSFLEFQEFSRTKVIFKDFSRSVRTLFNEGDNFCYFLFASLDGNPSKMLSILKKENLLLTLNVMHLKCNGTCLK